VANQDAGKVCLIQQLFQPRNARKIKVIGRLVQQQHIGVRNDSFNDGEALAPASRKRCGLGSEVRKAGAARGLAQASLVLGLGYVGADQCSFEHLTNSDAGRKVRFLQHIRDTCTLARGYVTGVGVLFACQHGEQRGLASAVWTN
jgi:hypothetical protein